MATQKPEDKTFTASELARYNGDPSLPIYVAIKGDVFDVSSKREVYGVIGKGYNVFTGKDSSKALGKSSLKEEDCVADYKDLTKKEMETLEQWYAFFSKRYNIVGKVIPDNSCNKNKLMGTHADRIPLAKLAVL
ncbi:hypothetical protein [Parasitella parasitica]|uniref:Cytochrome b5 heme-binding domain-containing protein n=1 Tax=Parasitella parasitica TaxID=35722 RepID=A0A0B7MSZ2_9FUNG|nr:hypothetical protein [Parasitella parasitica]